MANKTLNTRIKNKVDTYENWTSANPTLLAGEIAIVKIPGSAGAVQQEPATLFKVGDGVTAFKDLPFASGLAANVYSWALAARKPDYTADEIQGLEAYISGKVQDTNTKYKIEAAVEDPHTYKLFYKELNGEWTAADEIQGLEAYISGKVQDTNTKYKIEAAVEDPHTYKLFYKELNGEWTAQDTITIPKDTLTEGSANGTVAFNGEDVAVHGLGTAAYQADTYFATAEALTATDGKLATVEATANAAAPQTYVDGELAKKANAADVYNKGEVDQKIAGAVSSVYKPAGSVAYAKLPELSETVLGNVYNVTDAFTTDARFVEGADQKHPAGSNVVVVKVVEEYKFDVLSGFVDLSGHATKEELATGVQEAKTYADGLNTAMDARVQAVEADKHTHSNKVLLDTYTQTEENLADAVAKKHEHSNKTVLDGIDAGKVAAWDAKADDASLAAIAKSGNAKDLTQTPGEYIIFDCGTATTVI